MLCTFITTAPAWLATVHRMYSNSYIHRVSVMAKRRDGAPMAAFANSSSSRNWLQRLFFASRWTTLPTTTLFYVSSTILMLLHAPVNAQNQLLNLLPILEVLDFNLDVPEMLLLNKLFNSQCQNVVNGQVNSLPGMRNNGQYPANNVLEVNQIASSGSSASAQPLTSSVGQRSVFAGLLPDHQSFDPGALASVFESAFGGGNNPFNVFLKGMSNMGGGGADPPVPSAASETAPASSHDLMPAATTLVKDANHNRNNHNEKSGSKFAGDGTSWNPPLKKKFVILTDGKGRNLAEKLVLESTSPPPPPPLVTKASRPPSQFAKQRTTTTTTTAKSTRAKSAAAAAAAQAAAVDAAGEVEDLVPQPKARAVAVSSSTNKNKPNRKGSGIRAMRLSIQPRPPTAVRLVKFDRPT